MKRLMIATATVISLFSFGAIANAGHDFTFDRNIDDLGRTAPHVSRHAGQADILLAGGCRYGRNSYYRGGYYPPPRHSYYRDPWGGGYGYGHYHYRPPRRSSYYRGGYPVYPGRGFGISIGF